MKTAVDIMQGFRYKLHMMGVKVDSPMCTFCDNESVVKNTMRPESTQKKKHNAIAYHQVWEAQVAQILQIIKVDGKANLADMFTKSLHGPQLKEMLSHVLW